MSDSLLFIFIICEELTLFLTTHQQTNEVKGDLKILVSIGIVMILPIMN